MKSKNIKSGKGLASAAQDRASDTAAAHSAEELDTPEICWLAYSFSFAPLMDFSFLIDGLKKMFKRWSSNKSKPANTNDKTTHETI